MPAQARAIDAPAPGPSHPDASLSHASPPRATLHDASLFKRLCAVLAREPLLLVTLSYLFVSFIGLWSSYWFYRPFGISVLPYMQPSDFLVAGLREPIFVLALLFSVAYSFFAGWVMLLRERHLPRAAELRGRWWGGLVYPRTRLAETLLGWNWLKADTLILIGVIAVVLPMVASLSLGKASAIRGGGGERVRVTAMGAAAPLPGEARLLGTTASFVLLYWPAGGRIEAMPIGAVARIQIRHAVPATTASPAVAPRAKAAP